MPAAAGSPMTDREAAQVAARRPQAPEAYDALTADDQSWSAQRPDFAAPGAYADDVAANDEAMGASLTALAPGRRNNASVALLRKQFGLGADDGSISQTELEDARRSEEDRVIAREDEAIARGRSRGVQTQRDATASYNDPDVTGMRDDQLADKTRLATAGPRVAGEYSLRQQELINKGLIDRQQLANEGVVNAAAAKSGAGNRLTSGLMERVAAGSNVLAGVNRLRELRKGVWTGPGAGRLQTFLQQVPLVPTSDKFAEFKSETDAIKNQTIKAITGAQMSEQEVPRILGQVPLETDKDNVWEQKAATLERITRGLNARIALLNSGVPANVLDQIPIETLADRPEVLEQIAPFEGGARGRPAAPPAGAAPAGFTIKRH